MPPYITPIAVADNPWVKVVTALRAKILSTDLSFVAACQALFGKAPQVWARFDNQEIGAADGYFDPPLPMCPVVLLTPVNTPPFEDDGMGQDKWSLSYSVIAKYELRDGDSRKALSANYELLRTIMWGYKPGSLDTLRPAHAGLKKYSIAGDLTPNIAKASAQTVAKTMFVIRFEAIEGFLG